MHLEHRLDSIRVIFFSYRTGRKIGGLDELETTEKAVGIEGKKLGY